MKNQYAVKLYDLTTINTIVKKEPDEELLQFCYRAIECDCIELVYPEILPEPYVMVVDECGLMREAPVVNLIASYLNGAHKFNYPVVGNVLIMKTVTTDEGDDIAWLDYDEAFKLMNALDAIIPAALEVLIKNA